MAGTFEKYQKRRLISSYFSVVISIALVLFLLGNLGLMIINAKKVSDLIKEQISLTIYLNDSAKKVEINQIQKSLELADYTKSITFVSKEEAAELMISETGEDFMDFVGYNPLQNSIDIHLKADYVTNDKLNEIASELSDKKFVDDVKFDENLIELMNKNVRKISYWVLIFSIVFTLISVLLINSSIRLAVYSKRFIIKTMQMVGATKSFIRKPFIYKNLQLGLAGALIANLALCVVFYQLDNYFPELTLSSAIEKLALLVLAVFGVGFIITWISTFIATQRFLNLKTDQLY
ncbi:MAG: cell division protein FtsX [Flavobacteriaceae bacterium]